MMSMNSNKRKGRPAPNCKLGRSVMHNDKAMAFDGVYGNSRLMHAAASLIGCVVQVQVRDGSIYEGILRTFSHQFELVLETALRVKGMASAPQGVGPALCNLLASFPFDGGVSEKLIFKLKDVVVLCASNVDTDYAVKDNFTDTAISRFNGQVQEKELEPWEGPSSDSENTALGGDEDDGSNGWDANDMFRTNAEKYGVKSSYDNSLQEYTVPLTKKDTEDYKQKEAKATKIAHEIESNLTYQTRMQLENGDEEDRFSAVVRPEEGSSPKYVLPQKRRNAQGAKRPPVAASPVHGPKSYPPAPPKHLQSPSPPAAPQKESPPQTSLNGEGGDAAESSKISSVLDSVPAPPPPKPYPLSSQTLPPRIERRRENERKLSKQKGRNDEIEEFRKFSCNFKLSEESKEPSEESNVLASKLAEQCKVEKETEEKTTDISKSTLNPNAKEFVFNPNAKSFTPRSMPASSPQTPRLQAQSPVIVVPHSQMVPAGPLFTTMAPQYVMQPFAPLSQPPRFRKASSGQPMLAPAATPSQLTMQYGSPQLQSAAPPQQTMAYPQMNFVVGPRVVSPQPVGVVPTSHSVSYCDTSHLPTHLLNKYCIAVSAHPGSSGTSHTLAQAPPVQQQPPPQSQTPVLHPSPSPQPLYPPPSMGQPHHHHPMHHFPTQQVVLMQQQQQPHPQGPHHPLHLMHGQGPAGHLGGHMVPQMSLSTPPYVPHPQGGR